MPLLVQGLPALDVCNGVYGYVKARLSAHFQFLNRTT